MPARRTTPDASDHDLLIRIDTRLEVLHASVRENNQATTARLDELNRGKASYGDLDVLRKTIEENHADHQETVEELRKSDREQQAQLDWARRMIWIAIGVSATLQVIVVPVIIGISLRALGH
jgi:hypothetical protein